MGATQEVGADTLLGWIFCSNSGGYSPTIPIIASTGGGTVETIDPISGKTWYSNSMDNTHYLSLDVGEVTLVVDDDVACLSYGLGPNNSVAEDHSSEGLQTLVSGINLIAFKSSSQPDTSQLGAGLTDML